ncbi:MAG: hypothetical protein PHX18_03910 [Candidatus Gastranaerophilales bacterium]|nr:hypothetical protein [Candidatus Gastranaerophilales bacterium]
MSENTLYNDNAIMSPSDVRKVLDTNNEEIKDLCRKLKVFPKRDRNTGKTFFLKDDVEFLKRIKELHFKADKFSEIDEKVMPHSAVQNPIATVDNSSQLQLMEEFKNAVEKMAFSHEALIEKIETTLENKLDGLDEVVVELIQVKTENENLRIKLNQLTKENYELKSSLERFKPMGFGFFVRQ